MKSSFLMLLALAGTLVISTIHAPAAHAINTNTSASGVCQATKGPNPNLIPNDNGITNEGTEPIDVICSIPRSPLASGATSGGFYIDGDVQDPGVVMTCGLFSTDFTGALLGSSQFQVSGRFDRFVSLPAAQLTTWAYVNVLCLLPPNATLLGVTAAQ